MDSGFPFYRILAVEAFLTDASLVHSARVLRRHILPLRETRSLPSARRFVECWNMGTRQRGSLPSAALGKAGTRQRPSLPSAKHSAKRDTRQTSSLPSVRHSTKNNPRQNTSGDAGGPSIILCRVLAISTRQTCCLCRVSGLALGKEVPLPSANSDTRQSIFFYFCFQNFSVAFIQYLEAHVPI